MAQEPPLDREDSDHYLQLAHIVNGSALKDIQGVDQEVLNNIHRAAYSRYCSGCYGEALVLFKYLALMDHNNHVYLLGLGATLKELNQFRQAVEVLECITDVDMNDPRVPLCITECLIQLADFHTAKTFLKQAEKKATIDSRHWQKELQQIKRLKHVVAKDKREL